MSDVTAWLIELDGLTFGKCSGDGRLITCTFSDPAALHFKRQGDAEAEAAQLEARFPWMKGRLKCLEHRFINFSTTEDSRSTGTATTCPHCRKGIFTSEGIICKHCLKDITLVMVHPETCRCGGTGWYAPRAMGPKFRCTENPTPEPTLPTQYAGLWSYDWNVPEQCFRVTVGGFCIARCEDSEVAYAICKAHNVTPEVKG